MTDPRHYRSRCYDAFVSKHWQYNHNFSREMFEYQARTYNKNFISILPPNRDARIIDLACGCGFFLYFLQKLGYSRSEGIDLSDEQLRIAEEAGVRNAKKGDIFEYLDKFEKHFDMVVANDVIEHLTKSEVLLLLDRIHRSLTADGIVLISTVNAHSLFGMGMVFNDFTHEQAFTPMSLSQVLRVCSFKVISLEGEKGYVYDLRSGLRYVAWWLVEKALQIYTAIERGTGRGLWLQKRIFEPRMHVVGKKHS